MLGAAVISSVSPRYWRVANVAYLERFQREEPPNSAAAPDRVPFVGPALPRLATARRKASRCRNPKARGRVSGSPLCRRKGPSSVIRGREIASDVTPTTGEVNVLLAIAVLDHH